MEGKTIAEKILGAHAHADVSAGDIVLCDIDGVMIHDANGPLAIRAFEDMGGGKVFDPQRIVLVFDHCTPPANEKLANIHAFLRRFVQEQGVVFYEGGRGVCHQLMVERGAIRPGDLVVGSDSHTCTYGALGALSTGLGATDIAAAMRLGRLWFKVPETIRVELKGQLPPGCGAKDVILTVIGMLGADGCSYKSVEFYGGYLETSSLSQRLTIANMVVEMGAKCGFTCHSGLGVAADRDARYERTVEVQLDALEPVVSRPHTVDQVVPVREAAGVPVQQVVLGSCTNGRYEDLALAAGILKGRRVHEGVRLLVLPASAQVLRQAAETGVLTDLIDAGAAICTPGCGVCVGTLGGVPADHEVVLSTTNRNFKGRMGNNRAQIYLSSPQTAAASALAGAITDPRDLQELIR